MTARRSLRVSAVVLGLVALQGLLVLVYRSVEEGRRAPAEAKFRFERVPSRPAPDLLLADLDGKSRKLSALRGRPVLLHFWATWCPPCRDELPSLIALGSELSSAGRLQLVAVSLDADWKEVREFFGGDVPREVVLERSGLSQESYDLSTLPDTYLLSADGMLLARLGGARDWQTPPARDALLQATSAAE
jgi:thiol-disulfide isomerase/thioredoxin